MDIVAVDARKVDDEDVVRIDGLLVRHVLGHNVVDVFQTKIDVVLRRMAVVLVDVDEMEVVRIVPEAIDINIAIDV